MVPVAIIPQSSVPKVHINVPNTHNPIPISTLAEETKKKKNGLYNSVVYTRYSAHDRDLVDCPIRDVKLALDI
jgi:hypothetical protein